MSFWGLFKQKTVVVPSQDKPKRRTEVYEGTNIEFEVPSVDDLIKDARPSTNGLYPHEILMIAYAGSKRINYIKVGATDVSKFWRYKYGVDDVPAVLGSLKDRGFLQLAEDGKTYKPTEKGRKEERDNAYVYYIHRYNKDGDMTPWHFNEMQATVPDRMKNYSWKDKYWWWLNQRQVQQASQGQMGLARNTLLTMAQFRAYESNYRDALSLLDEVIRLDKKSGDFSDFKEGTPPGLIALEAKWQKKLEK